MADRRIKWSDAPVASQIGAPHVAEQVPSRQSEEAPQPRGRGTGAVTWISTSTAVLSTVGAVLEHPGLLVPAAASACVAAASLLRSRHPLRYIHGQWIFHTHGCRDQSWARRKYPRYTELVKEHPRLLDMSAVEFSQALNVRPSVARYFLANPHIIPSPEIVERVCRALLVPPTWAGGGVDYGDEFVERRLLRYHGRHLASGFTLKSILEADTDTRRALLRAIEDQLREECDLGPEKLGGRNG